MNLVDVLKILTERKLSQRTLQRTKKGDQNKHGNLYQLEIIELYTNQDNKPIVERTELSRVTLAESINPNLEHVKMVPKFKETRQYTLDGLLERTERTLFELERPIKTTITIYDPPGRWKGKEL